MPARGSKQDKKRQRTRTKSNGSDGEWEEDFSTNFTDSLALALKNRTVIVGLRRAIFDGDYVKDAVSPLLAHTTKAFIEEIDCLKGRIEEMEQYSRRQSVRISGIPESEDENTDMVVLDIARRIGLELQQ
jgi:hypothetical protein